MNTLLTSPTLTGRIGRLFGVLSLFATVGPALAENPPTTNKSRFAFDKDRQFVSRITDLRPLSLEGWDEREPYEDVLLHANGFNTDDLASAARRDVSMGDMLHEKQGVRDAVRLELVHIQGNLKRLKRIASTTRLKEAGISELYEAWIFPRGGRGTDPVCVVLTHPPAGVEPADDITPGVSVVTAGYFFKVLEYQSNQPNPKDANRTLFRRSPLLLGHGMTTGPELPPANASVTDLVTLSLVFGGVVLVALVGLAVWMRRTDSGSRRANTNRLRNPYTPPPVDPPVPPVPAEPT